MKTIAAILVAALIGPITIHAQTQSDRDYFAGKTITYIVATKPGGGYDTYARLIAEQMEKHLPGTRIRVKNVPGAGHIVGTNQLYVAKPDGFTIGTFNTGLIYAQLLQREGVKFDLTKLSWIGKAASDARVLVVSTKSGINSFDDLRNNNEPTLFASSGVGTASHNESTLLSRTLGFDAKIIPGFSGNEGQMAMMRGEIAATFGSYSSMRPFIENGYGKLVLHVGGDAIFGDELPAAKDLTDNPSAKAMIALIEALSSLARFTAGPPGMPAGPLGVLRDAYRSALSDPALLEKAEKMRIPIDPLFGDDVARLVTAALDQPADNMKIISETLVPGKKKK